MSDHSIECSEEQLCITCDEKVVQVNGGAKLSVSNHSSFPGETGKLLDIIRRVYAEDVNHELHYFLVHHEFFHHDDIICNACLEKVATVYSRQEKAKSATALLTVASKNS
jgi:hypothetical protein